VTGVPLPDANVAVTALPVLMAITRTDAACDVELGVVAATRTTLVGPPNSAVNASTATPAGGHHAVLAAGSMGGNAPLFL
jgi:hypothetical protein